MKYKIHNIDLEHGCKHEVWGISCKRFVEIDKALQVVVKKLNKQAEKKEVGFADIFRESYKVAKNDNELLLISYHLGVHITKAETVMSMGEKIQDLVSMRLPGLLGLKKKEDLPN